MRNAGGNAMSNFNPVGSQSSNGMRMCVCVCGRNELEVCTMLAYPHISVHSGLCQCYTQAHAHTHPQTIWGQRTDGAKCAGAVFYNRGVKEGNFCRISTCQLPVQLCVSVLLQFRGASRGKPFADGTSSTRVPYIGICLFVFPSASRRRQLSAAYRKDRRASSVCSFSMTPKWRLYEGEGHVPVTSKWIGVLRPVNQCSYIRANANDSLQSPGEIKRREVVLDPQVSPEEITSREVVLG